MNKKKMIVRTVLKSGAEVITTFTGSEKRLEGVTDILFEVMTTEGEVMRINNDEQAEKGFNSLAEHVTFKESETAFYTISFEEGTELGENA